MEFTSLLVIAVAAILVGYAVVSYPVLKWLGVKENLPKRSFSFGSSIFLIQAIASAVGGFIGLTLIGSLLGLIGSYYYVKSVLNISPYKNIAIIFFLPIVAVVPIALILKLWSGLL